MYRGWISERADIEDNCGVPSVLNNFPQLVGQDVTSAVIRSLVQSEKNDFFKCTKDLDWTMEVICYGLSMPMVEVEMLKNCVFLYVTWSSVMSDSPKNGIPSQIVENKEFYFTKILKHLTNLFIPRESQSTELQAIFCTQILNCVNGIVLERNISKSTSEDILHFYLGICGKLLSVPPMQGGLAEQLCEKLINSLIQSWLYIACDHFPSPTLWCTLNEMFLSWRHHPVLITQWNQLMHMLTCKVLDILYGPNYSQFHNEHKNPNIEPITLPANFSDEIIVQCWFRFLHSIGNPVALMKVEELIHTEYFMKYNLLHGGVIDSHPCLKSLPDSFLRAMKGISSLIDMFLGISVNDNKRTCSISSQSFNRRDWRSSSTGTMHKKYGSESHQDKSPVSGGRKVSTEHLKRTWDDNYVQPKQLEAVMRTDANCILHIFGSWIFDVCLSGVNIDKVLHAVGTISCGLPLKSLQVVKDGKEKVSFLPVRRNQFEPGRAQAFVTLCNVFCHPRIKGQSILPVYLSRFYLSLAVGLCYGETRSGQVLGSILMTATEIFRLDLQGVQVLVPHILQALEIILPVPDGELNLGYDVDIVALRRSCIHILLSMICLPLHFLMLPIQGLCREKVMNNSEVGNGCFKQLTFISLKKRITTLLMKAMEAETNPLNTHMLLGGVMLLIEDNMCVENKSDEFGIMNPDVIPVITIDEAEAPIKGSPKLIHIAKGSKAVLPSGTDTSEEKDTTKNIIGSIGAKDDILTTQGQFVYLTGLLCQNMMFTSKWRGDLHLSLSSLECLSKLAQLDSKFIDDHAARKTVKWICDYIECQANQPPPSHSKDLHSQIVAAFNCISVWIVNHPWLMENLQCLQAVLEVVELGISGCKSNSVLKAEKELKPVSFRVRAAAEALLALMMEHLGYFPTPSGPANICSMLDETQFLQRDSEDDKFNYYAIDGSVIIGLKEDSVTELPDKLPSIISIIRSPTGKKVCVMQMRHFSRANHHFLERYKQNPERPLGVPNIPKAPECSQQHFPDEVNRVERIKGEDSIPDLQNILDEKQQEVQNHMKAVMSIQSADEKNSQQERSDNFNGLAKSDEYIAEDQPEPKDIHKTARLLLSHMGMLKLQNMEKSPTQQRSGLQYLDNCNNTLESSLKKLDSFSSRTFDTIYVFFVKKGQYEAREIIQNKVPTIDNQLFMEFLHSLGWLVDMSSHTGWNGDLNSSWKTNKTESCQKKMFYYADLMTEVAIHVPAINLNVAHKTHSNSNEERSRTSSLREDNVEGHEISPTQTESETEGAKPQLDHIFSIDSKRRSHNSSSDTKVVVAWMQDMNDAPSFPGLDLVELCDPGKHPPSSGERSDSRVPEKEVIVIFVHPLKTGLFRVQMRTATTFKSLIAGPLVNDMVVSRRVLGAFVRTTSINICRRRRLEIDSYSHPHVCRKIKIQEIIRHHAQELTIPEFYSSFFKT